MTYYAIYYVHMQVNKNLKQGNIFYSTYVKCHINKKSVQAKESFTNMYCIYSSTSDKNLSHLDNYLSYSVCINSSL
jgi:hypothetical protein